MSKEILQVAETVSLEKGVPKDIIFDAIETALATATKRRYDNEEAEYQVDIDRESGDYETFRVWLIVNPGEFDEVYHPDRHTTIERAQVKDPALQLGDFVREPVGKARSA